MINLILIVDKNWGFSKDDKKIYNLPKHEKRIQELIENKSVIIGFNYYMERQLLPFENCTNYVIGPEYVQSTSGVTAFHSISEALSFIEKSDSEFYVLGGLMTLKSFIPYATNIYITQIDKDFSADTKFPNMKKYLDTFVLQEISEEYSYRKLKYRFLTYESMKRNRY